jgi:predicted Zn-dependent peptidase
MTNRALANRIGYDMTVFGRLRPLEDHFASLRAVTVADVQRVAQTYLTDKGISIVQVIAPPVEPESPTDAPQLGGS